MAQTRKEVTLTIDLVFVGDYYHANELVDTVTSWTDAALEDRMDLEEWTTVGSVVSEEDVA